jgi:hypothetical protein
LDRLAAHHSPPVSTGLKGSGIHVP